jgi:CheY-like chemotaxis protein/GAF domain-containing protein
VADRARILVLTDAGPEGERRLQRCRTGDVELVRASSWADLVDRLGRESFDGVLTDPTAEAVREPAHALLQAQRILAAVADGVALVDPERRIRWANPAFAAWCDGPPVGRDFYEALGSPEVLGPEHCPFRRVLTAPADRPQSATTRLHCRGDRYIELRITAVRDPGGETPQLIALGRDVSALVEQQQKLDALHKAGRELAALDPVQLADMSPAERIELLKLNIRRYTRDLLHYESVEVRLLDRHTNRLELLLSDGMMPGSEGRTLSVGLEGQGVTGRVAATGKSILCPDTACEPLYLPGAPGARSSLTVPLIYQDQVIGTFNVESPRPNAFGEDDLQFTEMFGHEIAAAVHTLELLSAEKSSAASQSVEAVSREVALPVDDILAAAATVLERYIGHDPALADKLKIILASARSIKQVIQKIGEDVAPTRPPSSAEVTPPPPIKGMRILVADKDERIRKQIHSLLGRWGGVVETARDGREALTMARVGAYDAILADIRLPDIDGYEAYRQFRQAQPRARVVLMTEYGYDPKHTLVKARQDGLRHVVFKPFRVDQLRTALTSSDGLPDRAG